MIAIVIIHNGKSDTIKPPKEILGADTETHKGYCRLICIENNPHHYTTETDNWQPLIEFLLNGPSRIAFWNLRFDVEAILKHFPEEFVKNLLYLTESEIVINDVVYTFKLIPWKVLTIREMIFEKNRRRTKRIVECFEAAQFYHTSLQKASQEVLKESKVENREFAESLNTEEILWQTQLPRIIEYCQDDAVKAGKLIRTFIKNASEPPLNLSPRNPISCAWYAKEMLKQCIPELKKIKSIRTGQGFYYNRPWKQWDNVGSQCYIGGRFEVIQKGLFHNAYNYDINSAYPLSISQLPNPYNLHFVKDFEPEGKWSMVKAEVWVPENLPISPLPYRTKDNIIFPTGNWTGWFHWEELRNASRYGVEFDIQKALNGYEPNGPDRPFESRILEFYDARVKLKDSNDPRELPYKIAMNSGYGVFYEKNDRIEETDNSRATEIDGHLLKKEKDNPGKYFYPFIAGWITSQTRIKILNAAMIKPSNTIFVATDGLCTEQRIPSLPISRKLGDWSEKKIETAHIFGTGIYEFDGKIKTRGFRKDHAKDPRPFKERMTETPEGIIIETIEKGPIHLNTSFKLKDYSMKDALTWITKVKQTNITKDTKRDWPKFSLQDLYSKQLKSTPKRITDNPLNYNPGLVWKGDTDLKPNLANRFLLGKMELTTP